MHTARCCHATQFISEITVKSPFLNENISFKINKLQPTISSNLGHSGRAEGKTADSELSFLTLQPWGSSGSPESNATRVLRLLPTRVNALNFAGRTQRHSPTTNLPQAVPGRSKNDQRSRIAKDKGSGVRSDRRNDTQGDGQQQLAMVVYLWDETSSRCGRWLAGIPNPLCRIEAVHPFDFTSDKLEVNSALRRRVGPIVAF